MGAEHALDVLIVSLGSTQGLRRADRELADSLVRAGASVEVATARAPSQARTLMLTDLAWARAARAAAEEALKRLACAPRAIVYSSTTAALLWPRPGAIRFDSTSRGNRPGRHGLWQRPLERRRLAQSELLLPWSDGALREAPAGVRDGAHSMVLAVAVEPSAGEREGERDIAAVTYAANPLKKGLDRVLDAWRRASSELSSGAGELVVTGTSTRELRAAGIDLEGERSVRLAGELSSEQYRTLVRRARVFICAPRREDHGLAQLEALADGCQLVTTPAPGPYAALPIAASLDARLVSEDLAGALRAALADPLPDYRLRAARALEPFSRREIDRVVAQQLLPRLLA